MQWSNRKTCKKRIAEEGIQLEINRAQAQASREKQESALLQDALDASMKHASCNKAIEASRRDETEGADGVQVLGTYETI